MMLEVQPTVKSCEDANREGGTNEGNTKQTQPFQVRARSSLAAVERADWGWSWSVVGGHLPDELEALKKNKQKRRDHHGSAVSVEQP